MKKIATTVFIRHDQDSNLRKLSKITKIPMTELIRQGIDDLLVRKDLKNNGGGNVGEIGQSNK